MVEVTGFTRKDRDTVESFALIDPTTPAEAVPVGAGGAWVLDFSDEFNGSGIDFERWDPWYPDTAFWATSVPGGHKTNTGEPQAYDPSAITVSGSTAKLTMRNESTIVGLPYTSGMLCSYKSYSTTYGFFEARMKLPRVQGSWPAFWLFPENHVWPPEIDIMESWGGAVVAQNYHAPSGLPTIGTGTGSTNIGTGFNTFGCLWQPGLIVWYVNGAEVLRFDEPTLSSTPMFIICNHAGDKDNPPVTGNLPCTVEIEYMRVWKAG